MLIENQKNNLFYINIFLGTFLSELHNKIMLQLLKSY